MKLAERLAQIEAAAALPGGLALRTVEQITGGRPDLLRVLECAAIPHAWDFAFLARLLDAELVGSASYWHSCLVNLSVVEPYLSRPGWHNVHEVTRQALWDKLHAEGRLIELSSRAYAACRVPTHNETPAQIIERLYHHLLSKPEEGTAALEIQWRRWNDGGCWPELLDLAAALEELLPYLAPKARAYALLCRATVRANRRSAQELSTDAEESAQLFLQLGNERGRSKALQLLGEIAISQGDMAVAGRYLAEAKVIAETLVAGDPASAERQYDLSLTLSKLGDLAVAQGDLAEALRYFKEAKTIAKKLAASDPTNVAWQRVILASLDRLGDLAKDQGDEASALSCYSESKIIRKRFVTLQADLLDPVRVSSRPYERGKKTVQKTWERPFCMLCVHCPKCVGNPQQVSCELCAACSACSLHRSNV